MKKVSGQAPPALQVGCAPLCLSADGPQRPAALRSLVALGGTVNPQLAAELSVERQSCLPTPAILVKGCLDECNVCEDAPQEDIKLELERKALENKLLAKQIELLEKSLEYRCCPAGEVEEEPS